MRVSLDDLESMPVDDQCYFLSCKGYNYRQIASMLGINKDTVMRRVKKGAAALRPSEEEREQWMQQSVDSFSQAKAACWTRFAQSGDPYLIAQIIQAEERIAKIHGLIDQNKGKIEVSGPNGGSIPIEFSARTAFARIAGRSEADS